MHVLTNAEKLIPLRDAASLAESRRLAGIRMVTGTTSPSTRYERISVSPASCSIKSEYVIASHAFKPQYKCINYTPAWEQRKLGEIADKVTEKNLDGNITEVLTNSAEYGVINQTEFFDHAVAKESNIAGYYVIAPGDFVYNPRISATAPVGPIRRNTLGIHGVMSPLYTVFRLTDAVDGTYLSHFFKTNGWHGFMKLEGNSGARSDRFSIGDATFFEMPIPVPSSSEQHAIGSFFSRLDDLITLHQRKRQWLKWLDEGGEGTHHDIDILVFKFADDMKISVLCGVHACMTKSLGHTGNRYAGKQQQRGMGVP